jgi:hypothetical protein
MKIYDDNPLGNKNHLTLICVGVKFKLFAMVSRSGADKYFCSLNRLSSSTTCDCENKIRGFRFDFGFPDLLPHDDDDVTM